MTTAKAAWEQALQYALAGYPVFPVHRPVARAFYRSPEGEVTMGGMVTPTRRPPEGGPIT